jgi:flagellar biosynthesis/type III secretory pathway protein FliH
MEALRTAEAELTVYVHPSNAKRVRHAVNRQLSALLFTCVRSPSLSPSTSSLCFSRS